MGVWLTLALIVGMARKSDAPADMPELRRLIPRFSRIAMISVAILIGTGVYAAWLHVQTIDALEVTTYGRAVIIKSAIVLLLIVFGAVNLQIITPRLPAAAQWLTRTTRSEL